MILWLSERVGAWLFVCFSCLGLFGCLLGVLRFELGLMRWISWVCACGFVVYGFYMFDFVVLLPVSLLVGWLYVARVLYFM